MRVVISKVHENLFSGEATSLTAMTEDGEVTILSNHEPFVANLKPGKVTVRTGGDAKVFEVSEGVLEVSSNQATVLL